MHGVTWIGECTRPGAPTNGIGFTLSNGRIGVTEPVSELNAFTISTSDD